MAANVAFAGRGQGGTWLATSERMQQRDDKKMTGVARLWAEVKSLFVAPRVRVVRL